MATDAPKAPTPAAPPRQGAVRGGLRTVGELLTFAGDSARGILRAPRYGSEILKQASVMLRGTSLLMLLMGMAIGFSLGNFCFFLLRTIGASDYLGVFTGYAIPRQLGPTMFGYVLTAKVCTGIAAEIGAMKVNEEIDAYESTGTDKFAYIVAPRLLAVLIYTPIATMIILVGELLGTYLVSVGILQGISSHALLSVHWSLQTGVDQLYCLISTLGIALTTTTVACFFGMRASGGPAGVGRVAAQSLTVNLVLVHMIAALCAIFFYGNDLRLPIGG
ncbi:MAG: MlaE family ABC transporter permease [Solirubrobacteraceae bacterium]